MDIWALEIRNEFQLGILSTQRVMWPRWKLDKRMIELESLMFIFFKNYLLSIDEIKNDLELYELVVFEHITKFFWGS